MNRISFKCAGCKKLASKRPKDFNRTKRNGFKHYCTRACFDNHVRKRRISVHCKVCHQKMVRPKSLKSKTGRYFCGKCRGTIHVPCATCSKNVLRTKSDTRIYDKLYCSTKCSGVGRRKDWDDLPLAQLRHHWIAIFGKESLVCNRCGYDKPYNIQLHHKKYVCKGGSNQPSNLEPLCRNCHGEEHYERGNDSDFPKTHAQQRS